jgi:hypothetical protein
MNKTCPNCGAPFTRAEWAEVRSHSSPLGGRLVRPCSTCGALLRLSRLTYVWWGTAFAALVVDTARLIIGKSTPLSLLHFVLGLVVLIAFWQTCFEVVPLDYGT